MRALAVLFAETFLTSLVYSYDSLINILTGVVVRVGNLEVEASASRLRLQAISALGLLPRPGLLSVPQERAAVLNGGL